MNFKVQTKGQPPERFRPSRSPYSDFVAAANSLRKNEWIEVEKPEEALAVASRVRALRRHLVKVNKGRVHSGPLRVIVTETCIVIQEAK